MYQNSDSGAIIQALVIVAATATVVTASGARQEALSGRIRALTTEFRNIAGKDHSQNSVSRIDEERVESLVKQIVKFEERLHHCIRGHIILYSTLLFEVLVFAGFFAWKGVYEQWWWFTMAIALVLIFSGMLFHLIEYCFSHKTIKMETNDIRSYGKEILEKGASSFLKDLRDPKL